MNPLAFGSQGAAPSLVARGHARHEDVPDFARYLADALGDPQSLAFYAKVVSHVPSDVIHQVLRRALELPAAKVRRSRAAYFTTIIGPHLLQFSST